ncbi:myelin-oligodendrocyte glycoprotein-like isoform X1 [Channa argus]|uniref:myelin-oligodendrocyte glycoprotein-like isoform X1 n=2 Tax=Channa argus TaxID=215402 RepID=UPI003522FB43
MMMMMGCLMTLTLIFLCAQAAQDTTGPCPFPSLIEAQEGKDVTLQCCVEPQINLKNRTVEWKRVDLNKIVHLYRHRKDDLALQMEQYRSRTSLNQEDLSRGILTLLVSSVQQSDSGEYRCSVPKWSASIIRLDVKKQQNMTVKDDFSTVRPQRENGTMPSSSGAGKKGVGAIVAVCLFALVLMFTLLLKFGKFKKCLMPRRDTQSEVDIENNVQTEQLTSEKMAKL